jgi:hypothetical protein
MRQARLWVLYVAASLVIAAVVILVPGLSDMDMLRPAAMGLAVGGAQAGFLRLGTTVTWTAATKALLAGHPWRETPVRVLNARGTILYLYSGEYIRVRRLPPLVRELVVRTGRVWLVGPDAKGRLAVRVDGLYTVWPAQRIPPRPGTAALAVNEPIAAMGTRLAMERLRPAFGFFLALIALYTVMAVFGTIFDGEWWWFLYVVVYVVIVLGFWSSYRALKRLSPTGPWVRATASEPTWQVRWNGTATGTVVLDFPDGRRFAAHIDRAPLDLFVNVQREKALWMAANGVVGFPHYPSVALARLVPTPIPVPPVPSAG